MSISLLLQVGCFLSALMCILEFGRMRTPVPVRQRAVRAGGGMLMAAVVAFAVGVEPRSGGGAEGLSGALVWSFAAIAVGAAFAWVFGKRLAVTELSQRIVFLSGVGGGVAAAIAAVALFNAASAAAAAVSVVDMDRAAQEFGFSRALLAVVGGMLGAASFSASLIVFAKRRGWLQKALNIPGQRAFDGLLLAVALTLGVMVIYQLDTRLIAACFAVSLLLGASRLLQFGAGDMPVVTPWLIVLTGLAVACEGYVLQNPALIVAGVVMGAASVPLTRLVAQDRNHAVAKL